MKKKYSFKYPKIDYNSKNMRKVAEDVEFLSAKSSDFNDFVEDGKNNPFKAVFEPTNKYDKTAIAIKDWQDNLLGYVENITSQTLYICYDLKCLYIRPLSKSVEEDDDFNEYQNFHFDILEIKDASTISNADKNILVKIQTEYGQEFEMPKEPLQPLDISHGYKYEASENPTLKVVSEKLSLKGVYYYQETAEAFFANKNNDCIVEFEPNNPHDKNAIVFKDKNTKKTIGYVPAEFAQYLANEKRINKRKLYVLPFEKIRMRKFSPFGKTKIDDFLFSFCIVEIKNFKKIAYTEKNVFIKIEKPQSIFSRILKLFWK